MPRKGMRSIFFHSSPHRHRPGGSSPAPTLAIDTFRATLMEDNVAAAERLIEKWDAGGSTFAKLTSLFQDNRSEARRFLLSVQDLHQAMRFFATSPAVESSHRHLVRGQRLMETAMARLRTELHQILAANRDRLDADSVSSARSSLSTVTSSSFSDFEDVEYTSEAEELHAAGEKLRRATDTPVAVMANLRSIVQCMISCGYARECVDTYKSLRRPFVDECLDRLGFIGLTGKLDWNSISRRIDNWLAASSVAVRSVFSGERSLCDFVFESSTAIKEPCFGEITRDAAVRFFEFPQLAALAKGKRSPEKVFRLLDMYTSVVELRPEIDALFSYDSTAMVRTQAQLAQEKLSESIGASLGEFVTSVQKDPTKETISGGGVHPLTHSAVDYILRLADYGGALAELYSTSPFPTPKSSLPEPFSVPSSPCSPIAEEEEFHAASPAAPPLSWILVVLLSTLDCKADLYKDLSLAYLFLANNLFFIVSAVRRSNLLRLLGSEWVAEHDRKIASFTRSYERLAWRKVLESIPKDPAALLEVEGVGAAKERMKLFNKEFEEAYKKQASWVVLDRRMRREMSKAVAVKVEAAYRTFYEHCRGVLRADAASIGVVRFAPADVRSYLADLFVDISRVSGSGSASPAYSSSGSSSGSPKPGRWRRFGLLRFSR